MAGLHAYVGKDVAAERDHVTATGREHRFSCGGPVELGGTLGGTLAAALELPRAIASWYPGCARRSSEGRVDALIRGSFIGIDAELLTVEALGGALDLEKLVREGRESWPQSCDLVRGDLKRP